MPTQGSASTVWALGVYTPLISAHLEAAGETFVLRTVTMSAHDGHIAVFWDYENCTPSSTVSGYDIMNTVRDIAHRFGVVKQIKAYLDLAEHTSWRSLTLRSELQSCGVTLTDCPHNGKKEVADKMMIVDMLTYAIDTPAPSTLLLITSDRDFAYAISVLRLRKYQVVLVTPGTATPGWKSQASQLFDWDIDVLGRTPATIPLDPTTPAFAPCPDPEVHHRSKSTGAFTEENLTSSRDKVQTVTFQPPLRIHEDVHFDIEKTYADSCPSPHTSVYMPLDRSFDASGSSVLLASTRTRRMNPATDFDHSGRESSELDTLSSVTATAHWEDLSTISSNKDKQSNARDKNVDISHFVSCDRATASLSYLPSVTEGSAHSGEVAGTQLPVWENPDVEIPPSYKVLLRCLEKSKKNGHDRAYRDWLGEALLRLEPTLYEDSGARTLARYLDHAEALGIIICGKAPSAPHGWVQLRPEWSGRVVVR